MITNTSHVSGGPVLLGKEIIADRVKNAQRLRSWYCVVWLWCDWWHFTHAWSFLVRQVPCTANGRSKGSQRQLSEVQPAAWFYTKWNLACWSSLAHPVASPCKGQHEYIFSGHISMPTLSCSNAVTCGSAQPILVTESISHCLPEHTKHNIPHKERWAFYKRQLYFKKDQISSLDVVNQEGELMSAEVTRQSKTLTNYEGRCQFQVTCFP